MAQNDINYNDRISHLMFAAILEVSGITRDHEWKLEGDTVVNGVTIRDSDIRRNSNLY